LRKRGAKLSTEHYNNLVKACGHKGEIARGEILIKEMKEKGLFPTYATYAPLLDWVYKKRDELVLEMQKDNLV
jgi:pentatricopeptide repeat protein